MTSGFSALTEYWLRCLSVHYSSKLMMQSTTCCLQLSVRVERSWQKCPVFCEQHVINSLGACSLYVDDYSLWYAFVYFWDHCLTSCAAFFTLFLIPSKIDRTEGTAFCVGGVRSAKASDTKRGNENGKGTAAVQNFLGCWSFLYFLKRQ